MSHTMWKWNYFTLENISKVKCSLCDSVCKPHLKTSQPLLNHLRDQMKDKAHKGDGKITNYEEAARKHKQAEFSWDSHYKTVFSDNMLKPYVKCRYCKVFIPMLNDNKSFIKAPPFFDKHLEKFHNIQFRNWQALASWICRRVRAGRDRNTGRLLTNQVIKVDRCAICDVEIGAKNAIMFVKHLIETHRNDPELNIPWDIIPKELHPSDVTVREDTTLSSDIADRQGSSGVFTESTQSSSKRKKEVLEMSELYLDYDTDDSFHDINTGDTQEENIMEIETSIRSKQSMANVLKDGSQIDMQVPSTQPPDPRDIPRTLGKRKGTQIPPNKRRKFNQLGIIKLKAALEYAEKGAEMWKMLMANRLYFDYDNDDSFHDINTGDSPEENIMEIETSISSNQSMANVLKDGSQIDMQVPSTQPPDPRDIPSTSSGFREDIQIPLDKRRRWSAVTLIKEPPYEREKSSSTDDS